MESIFDDLDRKTIAPQNFTLAIAGCILYVVLGYASEYHPHFPDATDRDLYRDIVFFLPYVGGVYIFYFFKNYLRNFRAAPVIKWVRYHIWINTSVLVVAVISKMMRTSFQLHNVSSIALLLTLILLLWDLIVLVRMGMELQKVENDFIGLLHPLGIILVYLMPVTFVGVLFSGSAYLATVAGYFLPIVRTIILNISLTPAAMLAVIFYRAMKFAEKQGSA